jgi:hypothetical protein
LELQLAEAFESLTSDPETIAERLTVLSAERMNMKKQILIVMSAALAATACAQGGGWKNPAYVTATISERFEQSAPREMTVTKKGETYSYRTTNEIDGMLGGVERIEVAGPNGFYTWLPNRPEVALRLWAPTSMDVFDYLAKPNFSRADLEVYVEGIEKALGKKVLVGKSEKLAGRDCLVLTILDKPGSSDDYQRLWIDRETGLAMKLMDVVKGVVSYEREVKSIAFTPPADVLFAPKEGAKILSGIVLPTTLLNVGTLAGADAFQRDISAVNQKSGTPWASATAELSSFGYAGSNFRQIRRDRFQVGPERVDPREAARQRRQQQRGNQIAQRARFVSQDGGEMQTFEIRIAGEQVIANQNGDVIVTTTAALPPTVGAQGVQGGSGGSGANSDGTTVYPMVQSDFVDAKTGNTLTLLQIDKRDLKPWLLQLGLDEGVVVPNEGAGNARFHVSTGPVKVNVLTWQVNQARLALVSTSLSKEQLLEIAQKIQPTR